MSLPRAERPPAPGTQLTLAHPQPLEGRRSDVAHARGRVSTSRRRLCLQRAGAERAAEFGSVPAPLSSDCITVLVCFLLSGSHHSGSPSAHCSKSTGSLDTSKVYIVSHSSGPPGPGSMSKPYHRQGAVSKYVIGWKKSEGSPPPEEPDVAECQG